MKTATDYMIARLNEKAVIQPRGPLLAASSGAPGGQTTYIYSQHRHIRNLNPLTDFDRALKVCSDSGIVKGDLLDYNGVFYLAMLLDPRMTGTGFLEYYLCSAYICNSVVTVYTFNETTRKFDIEVNSGVHCLLNQMTTNTVDDETIAVKTYGGRSQLFELWAQMDSGITKDCILVDQSGRRFRISKEYDPFIDENILRSKAQWEANAS
jgi:hypothetical protein